MSQNSTILLYVKLFFKNMDLKTEFTVLSCNHKDSTISLRIYHMFYLFCYIHFVKKFLFKEVFKFTFIDVTLSHCNHIAQEWLSGCREKNILQVDLFEQTMMGWSPRCYIKSFIEISPPVLVKVFEGFLPYMGVAAILVMWPASCSWIFISFVPKSLHTKFG